VRRFSSLAGVIALLVCAATATTARAQTGVAGAIGTTTPTTLAAADFFIGIQQTEGTNLNSFQLPIFFNKDNCDCDTPVFVFVTLTASGLAKRSTFVSTTAGKFQIWVGSMCDQILLQPGRCVKLLDEPLNTFMANARATTVATSARVFSTDTTTLDTDVDGGIISTTPTTTGFPLTADCTTAGQSFEQTVYALIDVDGDGTYDVEPPPVQTLNVDLIAPPAPTNITVEPGNEALSVHWTPVDFSTNMDLQGYQVVCQRADDLQVFPKNTFTSYIQSCDKTRLGAGLVSLDPAFTCSPLLTAEASSYRVKILQNGIWYAASVVAIDNSGNASPPVLIGPNGKGGSFEQPALTDSFYDVYRNGENLGAGSPTPQGAATGGFCAVAPEGAPRAGGKARLAAALGVSALLAAALARARRRRRR
jgi:fibronectin type III domain protein